MPRIKLHPETFIVCVSWTQHTAGWTLWNREQKRQTCALEKLVYIRCMNIIQTIPTLKKILLWFVPVWEVSP